MAEEWEQKVQTLISLWFPFNSGSRKSIKVWYANAQSRNPRESETVLAWLAEGEQEEHIIVPEFWLQTQDAEPAPNRVLEGFCEIQTVKDTRRGILPRLLKNENTTNNTNTVVKE